MARVSRAAGSQPPLALPSVLPLPPAAGWVQGVVEVQKQWW
jgi:hypothetical protein